MGEVKLFSYPEPADACIMIRTAADQVVAYSQKCTHLSCAVYYAKEANRLECPCHEGYFSVADGAVLQGPPPRALPRILLRRDGDQSSPPEFNYESKGGITAIDGAMALIAILLIVQMWLLTATLEAFLAGTTRRFLPAALISGIICAACAGLLFSFVVSMPQSEPHGNPKDPYWIFFPLGILMGFAGVSIWPLYHWRSLRDTTASLTPSFNRLLSLRVHRRIPLDRAPHF